MYYCAVNSYAALKIALCISVLTAVHTTALYHVCLCSPQAAAALSRDCSTAAAARTDAAHWRGTHGVWCNHALTLDATDDYTTDDYTTDTTTDTTANGSSSVISETITLPAAPWPPLQRYLLQLALQVAAVTCSADFATHAQLSATSLQKPLSRHVSTQLTHTSSFTTTAAVSDSSSATVAGSVDAPPDFYTAAGDAICVLAASHIAAVYRGLAEGNGAPLQRSPEPARLQALLDVMLLQQLPGLRFANSSNSGSSSGLLGLGSSASNRSSFQGVADVIGELIDPIDLQTYTPFLEATAKASAEVRVVLLYATIWFNGFCECDCHGFAFDTTRSFATAARNFCMQSRCQWHLCGYSSSSSSHDDHFQSARCLRMLASDGCDRCALCFTLFVCTTALINCYYRGAVCY
jgi:hypothetical protein